MLSGRRACYWCPVFVENYRASSSISGRVEVPDFVQTGSAVLDMLHADRQTDRRMSMLLDAFLEPLHANAPCKLGVRQILGE